MDCNVKFLNLRQVVVHEFFVYAKVSDAIMDLLDKLEDESGAARLLPKLRSATKELRKLQQGVINSQCQKRALSSNSKLPSRANARGHRKKV